MEDIFREIDEDLRSDRLKRLWRRFHVHILVAAGLIVLAVGAYGYWQQRETAARAAEGARYAQAMGLAEHGDIAGANQALDALAHDGSRGYGTLARLYDAALLVGKGDIDGALQRYDAIAADGNVDPLFRGLATLLGAAHRIDRDDPASVLQRLQPLLADDNPWRFSARELAGLAALKAGNQAEARANFSRLSDDAAAPPGIRARAAELLKTLGS